MNTPIYDSMSESSNLSHQMGKKKVKRLESTETTFTKIEFDKLNLFFKSIPNKISYDKVKIKNIGTTCVYFKWQKYVKGFNLPDKKSDGIDRFFCHYSDSKLFPHEEKEFVFSFFSEKNGIFSEDWILVTSPPIKNLNLSVHLNGMCLLLIDKLSDPIMAIEDSLDKKSMKTLIHEMILDLVDSVRPKTPPLPDMLDPKVFSFYFMLYNREYNVEFSSYIMKEYFKFVNQIQEHIQITTSGRDLTKWNGSLDELREVIHRFEPEIQNEFISKLNCLIHASRRKYFEESKIQSYIKEKLYDLSYEFNDISAILREELQIPPYVFDFFTRQSLNEKELNSYKTDLNKKREEFFKKTKKKPLKPDEEEKELNDYKSKLNLQIKEKFLNKLNNIDKVNMRNQLDELILNSYQMDEEYIDRLYRVKSLKTAKMEGLEGKIAILRIDIDSTEYQAIYENRTDLEGNIISRHLKEYSFPNAKETIFQTTNFLLDNRVKAVLLLVDFGPKHGKSNPDFKVNYLKDYLDTNVEQNVYIITSLDELEDIEKKIDDEIYKDNSLIIFENLNFFPEECGYQIENDPFLITVPGTTENLNFYYKNKFTKTLSLMNTKNQIFINDSVNSIMNKFPTVIDMQCELKCVGLRIESQLQKLTNFLSINSNNFLLIVGDVILDSDDILEDEKVLKILLLINCLLTRFKYIFLLGKIGLLFVQYIQNDFIIDEKFKFNPIFHNLVKYILVRANLSNVKIILPEDGKILPKTEYEKYRDNSNWKLELESLITENNNYNPFNPFNNPETQLPMDNYMKYVKKLLKMEKRRNELIAFNMDPEELNENEDYLKNRITVNQELLLTNYKNNKIEFESNSYKIKFVTDQKNSNPKKTLKNEFETRKFLESIYHKEVIFSSNLQPKPLFNNENFIFVDYGEKTYNNLVMHMNKVNGVMWLGKLSPSIIENLNDQYFEIIKCFKERKEKLSAEFQELMLDEEKKLQETDIKAKKYLYNIFIKSKLSYDIIKQNFLYFVLPPEDKDAEVPPDEDGFTFMMNNLIDFNMSNENDFVTNILTGKHIPGIYGVSQDPKKEKEPEIDLKFLEDIY